MVSVPNRESIYTKNVKIQLGEHETARTQSFKYLIYDELQHNKTELEARIEITATKLRYIMLDCSLDTKEKIMNTLRLDNNLIKWLINNIEYLADSIDELKDNDIWRDTLIGYKVNTPKTGKYPVRFTQEEVTKAILQFMGSLYLYSYAFVLNTYEAKSMIGILASDVKYLKFNEETTYDGTVDYLMLDSANIRNVQYIALAFERIGRDYYDKMTVCSGRELNTDNLNTLMESIRVKNLASYMSKAKLLGIDSSSWKFKEKQVIELIYIASQLIHYGILMVDNSGMIKKVAKLIDEYGVESIKVKEYVEKSTKKEARRKVVELRNKFPYITQNYISDETLISLSDYDLRRIQNEIINKRV